MEKTWNLLSGLAEGGPRHGVKLSCDPYWNGIVMKKGGRFSYPGFYSWEASLQKWVWNATQH